MDKTLEELEEWASDNKILVSINMGRGEVFGLFYDRYGFPHSIPACKRVEDFIKFVQDEIQKVEMLRVQMQHMI